MDPSRTKNESSSTPRDAIAWAARRLIPDLTFLKGSLVQVLAWPAICISVGAVMWFLLRSQLTAEEAEVRRSALADTSVLARAYAQYVAHAIEQVDQITLRVKYDWEHSARKVDLAALARSGIFRSAEIVNVLIVDRRGRPTSGTEFVGGARASLADRDYFAFHRDDRSDVLMISKPVQGRLTDRTLLVLTRRLDTRDGAFDGMVAVGIEPQYLTAFYAGANPGKTGLLAVIGADGTLRAARIGDAIQRGASGPLRAVPLFDTRQGARLLQGAQWFADGDGRFVAWETLGDYPLIAVAGIAEREYLAPHRATWGLYRNIADAASVVLLLVAALGTARSISLARARQRKEDAQRAYRVATEGGNEGFYMFNAVRDAQDRIVDFEIVDCNERGADFYGISKAQLVGARLSALYSGSYFDELVGTFRDAMASGFQEEEIRTPRESRLQMQWARRRLVRSGSALAVTMQDITERKLAEERIEFLAQHDPLTHLPNRVLLRDRFEQAMAGAHRERDGLAVLCVDLDNFKHVNDTYGHAMGDQLLIEVVSRLRRCIRETDTICRQGGDEFIVIASQFGGIGALSQLAQGIVDAVSEPANIGTHTLNTTASVGISVFPSDGGDFDTLLRNADTAMYQAKAAGRNSYCFFTEKMNADAHERLRLQTQLRQALPRRELLLDYQPQIDLLSGRVIGMEALIRWQHPELGIVSPARFIPLAENSGLIVPIGEWVLEEACAQARAWLDRDAPPLTVAVNISAVQFQRGTLVETLGRALDRAGVPPGVLELELTESVLLQDLDSAFSTIRDLKALGVRLSIDDFGTGYSSLNYLKRLKVDKLKIDQSFVRDIATSADDLAIVRSVIQLGKTLQLRVIAEGVETSDQLDFLKRNGCDEGQGHYFCRPLPPAALTEWLGASPHAGMS